MTDDNDDLRRLRDDLNHILVEPSNIFLVPNLYQFPYPARFVDRKDETRPLEPTVHAEISYGDRWINEQSKLYYRTAEQEVLLQAKVRPFLVLRPHVLRDTVKHGEFVLGLPLTSLKPRMLENQKFMNFLKFNKHHEYYYIPEEKAAATGLHEPSLVVITTPYNLNRNFFTHHLGFFPYEDYAQVVKKLLRFLSHGFWDSADGIVQ